MIRLQTANFLVRWFVWSCDHMPFTVTAVYDEDKRKHIPRTGAYYVANGTTLCHIFWAILWVPLLLAVFGVLFLILLLAIHVGMHNDIVNESGVTSPIASAALYFVPELFALGAGALFGFVLLALIGGSKTGFFMLLWQYLKGVKSRICPLVRFEEENYAHR